MTRWIAALPLLAALPAFASAPEPSARILWMDGETAEVEWLHPRPDYRIWGGQATSDFEAVVAFAAVDDEEQVWGPFCSGTVVHARWVLTAAHCVEAMEVDYQDMDILVVFNANLATASSLSYRWADRFEQHPGHSSTGPIEDDVGVVHMTANAPVSPQVVSDRDPDTFVGQDLTFVGYGVTTDGGTDGDRRRRADIQFQYCMSTDQYGPCDAATGYEPQFLYSESAGRNVCQGDSGGAAFYRRSDGLYELAGVNSFVTPGCVDGGNGAARVDWYLDWIEDTTGVSLLTEPSDEPPEEPEEPEEPSDPGTDEPSELGDPERPGKDAYRAGGFLGLCTVAPAAGPTATWLLLGLIPLVRRRRGR